MTRILISKNTTCSGTTGGKKVTDRYSECRRKHIESLSDNTKGKNIDIVGGSAAHPGRSSG